MQPPGGVADDDVRPAGKPCVKRVVHHGGGVRTLRMGDHLRAGAFSPDRKLLDRRRAEGIGRCEQHTFALGPVPGGQLADGGCLADPIDSNHQEDAGIFGRDGAAFAGSGEQLAHHLLNHRAELLGLAEPVALRPLAQAFDDQGGGFHPDVGHDELFLQLVEIFVIDPGGEGNPAQPCTDRGKNPHSVTLLS